MTRVKRICSMHSGDHIAGDEICEEGEFPVYGGNDLRGYYPKYNCEGPMLIVGRQGALCGNVHRINGKFWATEHALITTITHFDNLDYLYYLFTDLNFNQYVSQSAAQPGLAASKILQVETVLPPRSEQERIAAFLDEKCVAVDKAIEVKRKQLESIEAIWKNLLYRATTQGIEGRDARPARPSNHARDGGHAGRVTLPCMVSSGNALFPKIPMGWRVVRIKSIGTLRYGLGEPPETSDNGISMIRATDFRAGKIDDSKMIRVNPADVPEGRDAYLRAGEIIVVRSGAYAGDSTIIPAKYNGYISGYDMVVTITKAVPEFIAYAFLSKHILDDQLLLLSLRAAQPHVNAEQVLNLELPLPPKEVQRKIADYLTRKRDSLDSLAANLRKQIETLGQYRKSLIHECVTGTRRVG